MLARGKKTIDQSTHMLSLIGTRKINFRKELEQLRTVVQELLRVRAECSGFREEAAILYGELLANTFIYGCRGDSLNAPELQRRIEARTSSLSSAAEELKEELRLFKGG